MYFALDIGGTHIRVASKRNRNGVGFDATEKVRVTNNYEHDVSTIINSIKKIAGNDTIEGVGCGAPATFSEDKRNLVVAANLSDWTGKSFVDDLEKALGCNVKMENDDTVAALGEAVYGQGKDKEFVYVTWGTGFGAAYVSVLNGKPEVYQFEAGHQIIDWQSDRICGCGQVGCAEAFVGGGNIVKYEGKELQELPAERQRFVYENLANALINILAFRPISLVVMGGGVALSQKENIPRVQRIIAERLRIAAVPQLAVTELGDDLGLQGAFALLRG